MGRWSIPLCILILVVGIGISVVWFLSPKESSPYQATDGSNTLSVDPASSRVKNQFENAKNLTDLTLLLNQTNIGNAQIPADLALLITNFHGALSAVGISIIPAKNTAPWGNASYLTAEERKDPDIQANCRAINETMKHIWFFAQTDEQDFIGYWRGPNDRGISDSPLVSYDSEGQFREYPSLLDCLDWYANWSPQLASIKSNLEKSGVVSTPRSGASNPSPSEFHLQCYEAFKAKP